MTATVQLMTTVLPHSIDPAADFHVSLFFTHRLTPGDTNTLADLPVLQNWIAALRGATIALASDAGPIACAPITTPLDESAWHTAFPASTAVRAFPEPKTSAGEWKSYPATRTPDHALQAHYVSAFSSPVTTPTVAGSRLARGMFGVLSAIADPSITPKLSNVLDGLAECARAKPIRRAQLAADHAAQSQSAAETTLPDPPPDPDPAPLPKPKPDPPDVVHVHLARVPREWHSPIEVLDDCDGEITNYLDNAQPGDSDDPAHAMACDCHAAQRYYDRPEAQVTHQPLPDDNPPERPRPVNEAPDFHARAGSVGNTPALARALGFVLDLRVADLAALAAANVLFCDVKIPGIELLIGPATKCTVHGSHLLATSETDSWAGGFLRIGTPDYRVHDLDPDASGLKLEQHLRSSIRSYATELNGDPVSFAPGTLRSSGFSIGHVDRSPNLKERVKAAEALQPVIADGKIPVTARPQLTFEALIRGLRLEVWDDATQRWHSLHRRTVHADFRGTPLLDGAPDEGFLQNAPLSRVPGDPANPYYVHEVVAGWDGWSLAAPRPGLNVVHDSGQGDHPGTEHITGTPERPRPEDDGIGVTCAAAPGTLPALRYGRRYSFRVAGVDIAGNSVARATDLAPADDAEIASATAHLAQLQTEADDRDSTALLEKTRGTTQPLPGAAGDVAAIESAMTAVETAASRLITRPQFGIAPADFARLFAGDSDDPTTVTTPRLFLRWDALLPPTVVPRSPYTLGESCNRLVIRDSIDGAVTAQRHLVPPKSTQLDAELDGRFDALMTSGNPNERRRGYATALKERGSLFDIRIQNLDDPAASIPQPGVELHASAGADPAKLVNLEDLQNDPELQPAEGQYVVHDLETITLPYLPDSMARGVTLVFYRAGAGHHLRTAPLLQAVVVPYAGEWPTIEPLRLVLRGGPELRALQRGNVIEVTVPPGEQIAVAASTAVTPDELDKLGLWRFHAVHDPGVAEADRELLRRAAADGWLWWLTPPVDLRLVHATVRPAVAPAITTLTAPDRQAGNATATLLGSLDVHGASTERVELHATWSDVVDDPANPEPITVAMHDVVTKFAVGEGESASLVDIPAAPDAGTRAPEVPERPAVHTMPDTRFRDVDYRLHGTSRYREFFSATELPAIGDEASAGNVRQVRHRSSAKPLPPVVDEVKPMFLWEEETEPEHPFARRRTRRSGLRVWLERPWFSSGAGELLAVVVEPGDPPADDTGTPHGVSVWGRDPAFITPSLRNATDLEVVPAWQQRALRLGLVPEAAPGRPVSPATLDDGRLAYLYAPEFHRERGRWFVDIIFDAPETAWPFVRLVVARYQPNSIAGQALSETVETEFVQLVPERIATLSRPDSGRVRVTASGATAFTNIPGVLASLPDPPPTDPVEIALLGLPKSRRVVAALQVRGQDSSDLGWTNAATTECGIGGVDVVLDPADSHVTRFAATWTGELQLPAAATLATPGTHADIRVLVEEYEILPTDPKPGSLTEPVISRLMYADHLYL